MDGKSYRPTKRPGRATPRRWYPKSPSSVTPHETRVGNNLTDTLGNYVTVDTPATELLARLGVAPSSVTPVPVGGDCP